jgi:TolB protein
MRRSVVKSLRTAIMALCLVASVVPQARAQLRGQIVGPGLARMAMVVPELQRVGTDTSPAAAEFRQILADDLDMSGLFRIVEPSSYQDDPQTAGTQLAEIDFDKWQAVGARGLVRGTYRVGPEGMVIEARLFDVPGRAVLGARRLKASEKDVARLAHRMADYVMEQITGVRGPFDSRIAFVSNKANHYKEVYVYGFEGKVEKVTSHSSLTMAPSWHPRLDSILFTSFRGGSAALYSRDLLSGEEARLASKMGLNIGGQWAPDASVVAVAREQSGNTDLFALDFAGKRQWRIADHWSIDVDPTWSHDGKQLAFCSSRGGSPQVYVMDYVAGGAEQNVRRLTFQGSYNCSPTWSPDGRWIAYAGRSEGRFHIFLIPAAGGSAVQLTFKGSNEDPTWSPDSRYVAYSSDRGGQKKIFMVDLTGRWERQLTTGAGDDTAPSWSPRRD